MILLEQGSIEYKYSIFNAFLLLIIMNAFHYNNIKKPCSVFQLRSLE